MWGAFLLMNGTCQDSNSEDMKDEASMHSIGIVGTPIFLLHVEGNACKQQLTNEGVKSADTMHLSSPKLRKSMVY